MAMALPLATPCASMSCCAVCLGRGIQLYSLEGYAVTRGFGKRRPKASCWMSFYNRGRDMGAVALRLQFAWNLPVGRNSPHGSNSACPKYMGIVELV